MRIGIDIDDTVADSEIKTLEKALLYDKEFVKGEGIVNINKYNYTEKFNWTEEQCYDFFKRYLEQLVPEFQVKNQVKETIDKLKEENHTIYFITYRTGRFLTNPYDITYKWLVDNGIKFDKLITNSGPKGKVCQENNIDLFIDDSVDQCVNVSAYGIDVLLFDNIHNRHDNALRRVNNWLEIYKIIKEEYHGGESNN